MSSCTNDCKTCNSNCADRREESLLAKPHELSNIKKIIGVVSGKGGVGKSMVTSLLSVMMSRKNQHVGILDADITGPSIPKAFGIHGRAEGTALGILPKKTEGGIELISVNLLLENETDPVIFRGPVIAGTVKQFYTDVIWENEDYLFIDMPPGTGDVPLTVFQSIPVDGIIIVTSPQELVSMIVEKAVKMAEKMNIPVLGIVENMSYFVCPNCNEKHYIYGNSRIDEIAAKHNIKNVSKLPINPELAKACDEGRIENIEGEYLKEIVENI
ncbi:MAG: Mrp/NBP35 family ATP-binding protein [Lachnospiraceae bacterium]|nr:Mrp/NBP35 family ATP-binding protein [Lachnospiraceae bacterium]